MHPYPRIRAAISLLLLTLATCVYADNRSLLLEPSFSQIRLSPDGLHIAAVEKTLGGKHFQSVVGSAAGETRDDGGQRIIILNNETHTTDIVPVSNGKNGDANIIDLKWVSPDRLAIVADAVDNAHRLHTFKLGDKSPTRRTKDGKNKILSTIPGTTRFLVLENPYDGNENKWTVREYDAATEHAPQTIYQAESKYFECFADAKGAIRLVKKDDTEGGNLSYYSVNPETGAETKLKNLYQWIRVLGIVGATDKAIVSGNINTQLPSIYVYDLGEDKTLQVLADQSEYSIDRYGETRFDPHTGKVVGLFLDAVTRASFWSDSEIAKVQTTLDEKLPGSVNRIQSWDTKREKFLVLRYVSNLPTQILYADLTEDKIELAFVNGGRAKPEEMGPTRLVEIPNRDGNKLSAILTVPAKKTSEKKPLLIWLRNGIWSDLDRAEWNPEASYFAAEGFVVLRINYSGSDGLLGPLKVETNTKEGIAQLFEDIEDSAKALIDAGLVDPEKVCIGGIGPGAWAAAYAPIATPHFYKAAFCLSGVYDFKEYRENEKSRGGIYLGFANEGSPISDSDLVELSPTLNATDYDITIFLSYGKWGESAYKSQSTDFQKAAKKAGANVKLHVGEWWGAFPSGHKRIEALARGALVLQQAVK